MKRPVLIVSVLLMAGALFVGFKPASFAVVEEEGMPVVRWSAESEDGLHHYDVEVHMQFSSQPRIVEIEPRGAEHVYEFRDHDLYKSAETVTYTLVAVLNTGERFEVGSQSVNYTPTAVRRTWGSIKAMFQ